MVSVEIDPGSGFCGGVIRAITRAEEYLSTHSRMYSLGDIVHNEAELSRLEQRGLITVKRLSEVPEGGTVLIRAHGEPPSTYQEAARRKLEVIDCSCPVVLQLQKHIREAYASLHAEGMHGQVIIFGRVGHAEVLGLLGQVGGDALVVENEAMLLQALPQLDFSQPMLPAVAGAGRTACGTRHHLRAGGQSAPAAALLCPGARHYSFCERAVIVQRKSAQRPVPQRESAHLRNWRHGRNQPGLVQ